MAYFIFFIIADKNSGNDNLMLTKFLLWLPNLACLAVGILLFRKSSNRA